jgi:hypothetical protein
MISDISRYWRGEWQGMSEKKLLSCHSMPPETSKPSFFAENRCRFVFVDAAWHFDLGYFRMYLIMYLLKRSKTQQCYILYYRVFGCGSWATASEVDWRTAVYLQIERSDTQMTVNLNFNLILLMMIQCYLANFMWILDDFGFWFSLETWASFARRVWGIPSMSRQSGPPPSPRGAAPGAARVNVSARWLVWSSISDQICHLWS